MNFLPSVLPISVEVNEILVRMLDVDWRDQGRRPNPYDDRGMNCLMFDLHPHQLLQEI